MPTPTPNDYHRALLRSTWERLVASRDILLVSPKNPDGDSLGSMSALRLALATVGKPSTLFCVDPAPTMYDLLPDIHELIVGSDALRGRTFDAVVIVDAGDLAFTGIGSTLPRMLRPGGAVIVIDHHGTNTRFGTVNCVLTDASSTTSIIAAMLDGARIPLTPPLATAILLGLTFDTDGFSNPATTTAATALAARCVNAGARVTPILRALYRNKPIAAFRLWGRAFERLTVHSRWGVAVTILTPEDFAEVGDDHEWSSGLSNFLQNTLPVSAILVLKDSGSGIIRGSLRTQRDDVQLGKLAEHLGGGGHQKAAGFGVPGHLVRAGDRRWMVVP